MSDPRLVSVGSNGRVCMAISKELSKKPANNFKIKSAFIGNNLATSAKASIANLLSGDVASRVKDIKENGLEVVINNSPPKQYVKEKYLTIKECSYLNNRSKTIEALSSDFDHIRKKITMGKGIHSKYLFRGEEKLSNAVIYNTTVNTRKIKIIVPKVFPKGKYLPTAHQLANALGTVPLKQLNNISQVVASSSANPDDIVWKKIYKDPSFISAASGGDNEVTFYPQDFPWMKQNIDSTMVHEGAHAYSQNLWKNIKNKQSWLIAIKKDNNAPSIYAQENESEDFAESLVMYSLSKGTRCETLAKKKYPERYKVLDLLLK